MRTRPFAPRNQDVSTPEDTRSFSEKMTGAEFRYNGFSMPAFAPSKELPTLQLQEVSEQDTQEESAAQTEENQPRWGVGTELSKPQSVGISPQSGTIQRLCDECAAEKEKEEEKQPETLQAKAEISEAKDYTQNTFSSIKGDEETQIWQPKNIGKVDAKLLARNQQSELSITKAKPSRIRAKKLSELVGNTETLSKPEVANPTSEVAGGATTETKELHETIQGKLTVGEPGDKYEQEADAVAAQVVSKINSPPPQESVQRESELGKSPGNDELMAQLPALPSFIPGAVLGRIGGSVSQKVLWQTFWEVVINRFGIRGAAAAALSLADGPLPIGELISIGIAIATLWDLFHLWNELWEQAATEAINKSQKEEIDPDDPDRDTSEDSKLSNDEIERLQDAGIDIHKLKKGCPGGVSKCDLFKDTEGNIYVKPKRSRGPGNFTGYNINDF